jgi:SAM-dependent methyltransferase
VNADLNAAMAVRAMLAGGWVAQSLYLAAKLGIADRLDGGAKTSGELAAEANVDAGALERLLRALAAVGIFEVDEDGRIGLTPLGRTLRTGEPGSLAALAIWNGEVSPRVWDHALYTLETGRPATSRALGMPMFEYLRSNPELGAVFGRAMAGLSEQLAAAVVEAYDFASAGTVVDVGGGTGTLLAAILRATEGAQGVLLEDVSVVEAAAEELRAAGLDARCRLVAGDFFESVPDGGDVYVLSSILHDWDDERAERILRTCRRAIPPHGRLLVVECVLGGDAGPGFTALLDLQMLMVTGGRERTEREYAALLERGGFRLARRVAMECPESLLEATPL